MRYLLILILSINVSFAQTTIYLDNMESTGWTWRGVPLVGINSKYVGGNSDSLDKPSNTNLYNSVDTSFGLFGSDTFGGADTLYETEILEYGNIIVNPSTYYQFKFKLSSFSINYSINEAAGVDGSKNTIDSIIVSYSTDNWTTYFDEIKIRGFNNAYSGFNNPSAITINKSANGLLTTYRFKTDTPITTVSLNLPLGIQQLSFRIGLAVNRIGEDWLIDDVELIAVTSLPIELVEFNGKYYNTGIRLYWSTASEINNDHFDILKSFDGVNFFKLTSVNGKGNSSTISRYEYIDYDVCDTIVYYKLKQVDYDGVSKEYDPIAFRCRHPFIYEDFYDVLGRKVKQDFDGIKIYRE